MKRELKFRAWDKVRNKMINHQLIINFDNKTVESPYDLNVVDGQNNYDHKRRFSEIELIQYVGFKDIGEKEIYEGDLFQVAGNIIYQIKYCENSNSAYGWFGGCFVLWKDEELFIPIDEYAMANGRVIGNVFQHSNLLNP